MAERRIVSLSNGQGRRLAQLAAFAHDIDEAHDALSSALKLDPNDPAQANLRSHLISAAAIAYFRCFSVMKNKPTMEGRIKLSAGALETHKWARLWRNRLVAHSDSGMRRTLAFGVLSRSAGNISADRAFAMTHDVPMPADRLDEYFELVTEVKSLLAKHKSNQSRHTRDKLSKSALLALWQRPESLGRFESGLMRWDPAADRVESDIAFTVPDNAAERFETLIAGSGV